MSKTPVSIALSKDLKKRGWSFVGPTTVYAFMQAMGIVNDHLATRLYLLGESFSMVDVICGSLLGWAQMMNLLEGFDHVRAYFKRVCTRPAFERAVH